MRAVGSVKPYAQISHSQVSQCTAPAAIDKLAANDLSVEAPPISSQPHAEPRRRAPSCAGRRIAADLRTKRLQERIVACDQQLICARRTDVVRPIAEARWVIIGADGTRRLEDVVGLPVAVEINVSARGILQGRRLRSWPRGVNDGAPGRGCGEADECEESAQDLFFHRRTRRCERRVNISRIPTKHKEIQDGSGTAPARIGASGRVS